MPKISLTIEVGAAGLSYGRRSKAIFLVEVENVMPKYDVIGMCEGDDQINVRNAAMEQDMRVPLVASDIDVLDLDVFP